MDADDVAQITASLRQALSADPHRARDTVLDFGWPEILAEEPQVAVTTLFPLAGELLAAGSVLDRVLVHAAGLDGPAADTRVVLPPPGRPMPPGRLDRSGAVHVDGVGQSGEGPLLVACADEAGQWVLAVCPSVPARAGEPLDPTAGWVRLTGTVASQQLLDAAALGADPGEVWRRMVAAGRRALAHELVAVATAMEAMTVEHVSTRTQFGQRLGAFQAVKHQLADVHLWRQVAALSADAAWEDGGVESAALAKAAALRASRTARAVCQQLLGGMGFTWEHDFHRYLRRALTLEPLLGDRAALHAEIGAAVRAGRLGDSVAALSRPVHSESESKEETRA
ncbi:acyl-CoA dehydrogenase [Nocardia farcinica]|uniref:acyl-CoA dehydrogenase family protein n=1 Tax=Nocardia farcinica TaxID=37329 RepID=UPI000A3C1C91|nr:acyl-CoA dehydrogenase family protein [Nocardia farcinica]MBA4857497.1 acyl-CoA dehydrogenase [Nocardia farcinica]MBC9816204.1 acyl-CoA dehydrogenase [Nocardia farcinica]MBF6072435.1 acyl-CoA dehydrogenase [Nocardia farcinica]MBF6262393.1 acyl-CoA dehydrogenase [Nocardia farcinica]MBF6280933.1 acyl-CoA dehydrogenase [Nocardia farcinica]